VSSRAATRVNRDIREWASARGVDLGPRGRIPAQVRQDYERENGAPAPFADGDTGEQSSDREDEMARLEHAARSADGGAPAPDAQPGDGAESAPVENRKRRLWELPGGADRGPRKRESLSTLAAFAWGGLAQAAARQGRIPTSRMLTLQAPVAGLLLDDALRGTLVDRILQPFARSGKRGEALFALFGPPLLVEAIIRRPDRQELLVPLLAQALEQYADLAGPKLAAAKKRAERRAAELGSEDIQGLIAFLFQDPAGGTAGEDRSAA
jgi:hypothetical protein